MTDLGWILRFFRTLPVFTELKRQLRFGGNAHFLERNVIFLRRKRVFSSEKRGNPATKNAFLVHGCTKRPVDRDSSGIRGQTALPWPCLGPQRTIPLVEMPFGDVPKHSHLANCLGFRPRFPPTDRMTFRARKTSLFPRLFARAGAKKGLARGQKSARNGQKPNCCFNSVNTGREISRKTVYSARIWLSGETLA